MALASHKNAETSGMLPAASAHEDEQSPSSLSQLAEQGVVVRNTFIHYPTTSEEDDEWGNDELEEILPPM